MNEAEKFAPEVTEQVIWRPQPGPQTALLACPIYEVLFGGARGGGKTDGMLGEWVAHSSQYGKNAVGLMVRRERSQLIETIERSKELYFQLGAKFNETEKVWRFPNGARIRFAYLDRDSDAEAYQGHSYTRVYVEELTNFPDKRVVMKLQATLRSANGVPVGLRATANPGGPGHSWVKERYIEPNPSGFEIIVDGQTGLERVFIPSKVNDNKYLDDGYVARLRQSGSEALVRAWLEGDWDAIEGAFFDEWKHNKHIVKPFKIPEHWLRFRAFDWGSAAPFCCQWYAVAAEKVAVAGIHDQIVIPKGALVCYREWYGEGNKLPAGTVAQGIKYREENDDIAYSVADPSIFKVDGGPSIAENMASEGVYFEPADNTRQGARGAISGWDQVRFRLRGDGNNNPLLVFFATCRDVIRTLPILQHDERRPEDLDTEAEDHAADTVRYACSSRPFIREEPKQQRHYRYQGKQKANGSWMGV